MGQAYAPVSSNYEQSLANDLSLFKTEGRKHQDVAWTFIYLITLGATLAGTVVVGKGVNPNYSKLTQSEYLDDYGSCHGDSAGLLAADDSDSDVGFSKNFVAKASTWAAVSAVGAFVLGFLFLTAFKSHPRATVKTVIAVKVVTPALVGLLFVNSAPVGFLIGVLFSLLLAGLFYLWRAKLELCARLLSTSSHALRENYSLVWLAIGMSVTGALLAVPHFSGIIAAVQNGHVVENSKASTSTAAGCYNSDNEEVACCAWEMDSGMGYYIALAAVSWLWTTLLLFDLRLYTIAGSVTQWYYAPSGSRVSGNTGVALKYGLTTGFGSLALASFVMTVVNIIRQIADDAQRRARREGGGAALLACLCNCFVQCIGAIIEFLSKFAVIQMALSGESFCDSARSVTGLLKRNFMSSYSVWWLPPMILNSFSFLLAAAWGIAVGCMSYASFNGDKSGEVEECLMGLIAFVFAIVILHFFASLLLNIVDVVYLCYVTDKDRQLVTNVEVHEVFVALPVAKPNQGPVVQQPDGRLAYAPPPATMA